MKKDMNGKRILSAIIALLLLGMAFNACERIYEKLSIPADNPVEEAVEDVIEKKTGIKLDLTPESPEVNP